jgi:hypothetical protein
MSSITHVFTTDKPWREMKELRKGGYTPVTVTDTEVIMQRCEIMDTAPSFSYATSLQTFTEARKIFEYAYANYSNWCKWNFYSNSVLSHHDVMTTLDAWEDLWHDVVNDSDDDDYAKCDNYVLNMMYTKMKEVLEFAVNDRTIEVVTTYDVEY